MIYHLGIRNFEAPGSAGLVATFKPEGSNIITETIHHLASWTTHTVVIMQYMDG
jgi:hypothetical protein